MPGKYAIKTYVENGYYHIFNRGVDKRTIFQDREDYTRFLYFLKIYLSSTDLLHREFPLLRTNIVSNNLHGKVELLAFCLMPNHFHLLVNQKEKDGITKFMRPLMNAYTKYFNSRHERVGHLFQGVYKAILVDTDEYLLHLSRYIHLNPLDRGATVDEYEWSSYPYYLDKKESDWLNPKQITDYFSKTKLTNSYKSFVEDYKEEIQLPSSITIEESLDEVRPRRNEV
jgi:putative transposase